MTIKDVKKNFIIDNAIDLFLSKSIGDVTIKDIAIKANVGEATIYRYFSSKQNLVCDVAVKLENKIFEQYFNIPKTLNGFEQLSEFYNRYQKIFNEHCELFKFINEFDAYLLSEGKTDIGEYSSGLEQFKAVFSFAYNQGVQDGSIAAVANWEIFYYATTHAMLELCKKLSVADIVIQDVNSHKKEEVAALVELILFKLKKWSILQSDVNIKL